MKKNILLLIAITMILMLVPQVQALWMDAYFTNGQNQITINPGQEAGYFLDIMPNSYAQSFQVSITLFDDTRIAIENLGLIESYTINSNATYFSPQLKITPTQYNDLPGKYFLDIKITQNNKDDTITIESRTLYFTVTGERTIVADYVYTPTNPIVNQTVTLTSTSYSQGNTIIQENWTLNGQLIGTGTTIQHVFTQPGTYPVTLTILDNAGRTASVTKNIVVTQTTPNLIPPVAQFTYTPLNPITNQLVTFTSTSYDTDGYIVQEEWFVNGISLSLNFQQQSTFMHVFTAPGTYTILLRVTDNDGLTGTYTRIITIGQGPNLIPPIAQFTYTPTNPIINQVVTFTSTSYDSDGYIVQEEWYVDGQLIDFTNQAQSEFTHIFTTPGTYNVMLIVLDNDGLTGTYTRTIVVGQGPNLIPPVAQYTYTPLNPTQGQTVTFTSTSYDVDGNIVLEEWYVDGQLHSTQNQQNSVFTPTFTNTGTYAILLRVTDNDGLTGTYTRTITIGELANIPPIANFVYTPLNPTVNQQITFISTSYDPDGYIVLTEWDFNNDGIIDATGTNVNYVYNTLGLKIITIKVTDNRGATATHTKMILIGLQTNVGPVAQFVYTPDQPVTQDTTTFISTSYDPDGYIVLEEWYVNGQQISTFNYEQSTSYYVFQTTGTYNIMLRVTDNRGATATATQTINVNEKQQLKAILQIPSSTLTGKTITLDGTKSYDNTGGHIIAYNWKIQKGTFVYEETTTTPTTQYQFTEKGTYTVTLMVINNNGLTDTDTKTISVGRAYGPDTRDADWGTISVDDYAVMGPELGIITDNYASVIVSATNWMETTQKGLRFTFNVPELGIQIKSSSFTLNPGKSATKEILFYIPPNTPKGEYDAVIGVSGTDVTRTKHFVIIIK